MTLLPPKGIVLSVSGPSGVGKGTVIAAVRRRNPAIFHSVSVTTRSPRVGETDGVEYHFRTREEFETLLRENGILEHDLYCGNFYGTPRGPLEDAVALGRDVIMDITVPGSLSVMQNYPDAVSIFLLPPSLTELRNRLEGRGTEPPEAMDQRLAKARDEISRAPLFDYVVVNEDVDSTAVAILNILEAERLRYRRQEGIEKRILEL